MPAKAVFVGCVLFALGCADDGAEQSNSSAMGFALSAEAVREIQLPDVNYWVRLGGGHFEDYGVRDPSAPNMLLNQWSLANAPEGGLLHPATAKALREDTALAVDLHDVRMTPQLLAQVAKLKHLEWLSLSSGIEDTDFRWLAGMTSLRGLVLAHANLAGANFAGLEDAEGLQVLALIRSQFTASAFARFPRLEKLETLNLGGQQIDDACLEHLAEIQLPALRSLNVEHGSITDAGIERLCAVYDLEFLNLYGCRGVSADSVGALGRMQRLHRLGVGFSGISPECRPTEAVQELQRLLPNCSVDYAD